MPSRGSDAPSSRSRRRDRDDSSESRARPASKRLRGSGGGDSRDGERRNEKKSSNRKRDREKEPPTSEQRRSSRQPREARDPLAVTSADGDARRPAKPAVDEASPAKVAAASEADSAARAKKWKEEAAEHDEDHRDLSDDDEAMERKLEEAKKRREALKAKYAGQKATEEPGSQPASSVPAPGGRENGATAPVEPPTNAAGEGAKGGDVSPRGGGGGGDMFDASLEAAEKLKQGERLRTTAIGITGASAEDWDDEEGYYIPKIGEVMGDRYLIQESAVCGTGVFSNVLKAKDQQAAHGEPTTVAIKVMRRNDMMTKAAEKEVEILERLNATDRRNKRHIIRLLSTFAYRRHFCMVFECMSEDLRQALKRHTKNRGITLSAVRAYTSQLLVGLGHMKENGVIHSDIKPDNILVSKDLQLVKFCDLGTALELKDITPAPYLASRFYRPPEVILGCTFSFAVDMWALGCTLFEIFTGKTLITSKSNNDHLLKTMELRGKIPGKVVKKGTVWKSHFTDELDFKHEVEDPGSGQMVTKTITDFSTKKSIKDLVLERVGKEKQASEAKEDKLYVTRANQFADLLEHMLALDPDKRVTPTDGLAHIFLQEGVGKAAAAAAAAAVKR